MDKDIIEDYVEKIHKAVFDDNIDDIFEYLETFPQTVEFAIAVAEFCDSGYEMEEVFDYLLARDELSKLLLENDDVLFFRLLCRAKILGYNLQIGEAYMPSGYDVERLV